MKRTQLLNRHLSGLISSLGHLDEITIADAGFPIPNGVPVIDLAVSPGVPRFWDVLDALRSELMIEEAFFAKEAPLELEQRFRDELAKWGSEQASKLKDFVILSHTEIKQQSSSSKAIIRTGEITPYCNLILSSGVAF